MKRKWIALALAVVMAAFALTACGDKKDTKEESGSLSGDVTALAYKGYGSDVMSKLSGSYRVTEYEELLKLEEKIKKGDFDVAVLPTTCADWLYGKTKKKIVELSPSTLGGLYLYANGYQFGDSDKMSNFAKKTIYVTGERSTGKVVFEYLMRNAGLGDASYTIKVLNSYKDIEAALKDYGNFAIVEEPYASQIKKSNSQVNEVLDMTEKWEGVTNLTLPTETVICSRDFYNNRYDDLLIFLSDYEEATAKAKTKDDTMVFYGLSNRGVSLLKDFNKEIVVNTSDVFGGAGDDSAKKSKLYFSEKE